MNGSGEPARAFDQAWNSLENPVLTDWSRGDPSEFHYLGRFTGHACHSSDPGMTFRIRIFGRIINTPPPSGGTNFEWRMPDRGTRLIFDALSIERNGRDEMECIIEWSVRSIDWNHLRSFGLYRTIYFSDCFIHRRYPRRYWMGYEVSINFLIFDSRSYITRFRSK